MNDNNVVSLAIELNMILLDFSNDSKASKRCFCNRAKPLIDKIFFELLTGEVNANTKRIT